MKNIIQRGQMIWGPVFLFCSLALMGSFDLLALTILGFVFSLKMQIRGFVYSMILLGVMAAIRHGVLIEDHLFQLGIEGSIAIAFLIIALSFEEESSSLESLRSQIQMQIASIQNLEEELALLQKNSQDQRIIFQDKIASVQKELEELQADHSSILILNEVLRKTTAKHIEEATEAKKRFHEIFSDKEHYKAEYEHSQEELAKLKNNDLFVIENGKLMQELIEARKEKEEALSMNTTLEKLLAIESFKANEALEEIDLLRAQLDTERQKIQRDPALEEKLKFAEEKMFHLSQIEPLFKQLKQQFEEKNQILHQTRSDLFKSDTELQKLKMEKASYELNPLPKELVGELTALAMQIEALEEENRELQELISSLNNSPERKKKVKIQPPSDGQTLLF